MRVGFFNLIRSQIAFFAVATSFCGCFSMPMNPHYGGPKIRPPEIEQHYARSNEFGKYYEQILRETEDYALTRVRIDSDAGELTIDYYKRPEPSDSIIFVFPVLGGKPVIESYFADYFARHGFDSAIVQRVEDFKDPKNIDRIEEILRANVLRDRYAMDFFERVYSKKEFGSFGISRGAITASTTAGIDPRLKHNVFVLGGSDLSKVVEKTNQRRIQKFATAVAENKNITKAQFFASLKESIKTDPKNFAHYIDARHTLMILGLFDRTVPFKYGRLLKKQIGDPKTIYLLSDHYFSLLYTQFFKLMPPVQGQLALLPFDYIETEALAFYRDSMEKDETTYKAWPYRILSVPFDILGQIAEGIF